MWTLKSVINLITTKIRNATRKDKISNVDLADVLQGQAEFVNERHDAMVETFNTMSTAFIDRFSNLSVTFYVNQATGNDTNSGLSSAPFKSLARVSQFVNGKFERVTVIIVGNYILKEDIAFNPLELFIQIQQNCTFTFAKRVYQGGFVGETNYSLIFLGYTLAFAGSGTSNIIVEDNAGFSSGDAYTWRDNQGAVKAGNYNRLGYVRTSVTFYVFNSIKVGNNSSLVTGSKGLNYQDGKSRVDAEFQYINNWTIGANATITPFARRGIFRKAVLFDNASVWKIVADQTELCLETGIYSVQVFFSTNSNGGVVFAGIFSGMFAWYSEVTGDSNSTAAEISMHGMAHNLNGKTLRLRTVTTPAGTSQRIEALLNETLSSPTNLQFVFTKLD